MDAVDDYVCDKSKVLKRKFCCGRLARFLFLLALLAKFRILGRALPLAVGVLRAYRWSALRAGASKLRHPSRTSRKSLKETFPMKQECFYRKNKAALQGPPFDQFDKWLPSLPRCTNQRLQCFDNRALSLSKGSNRLGVETDNRLLLVKENAPFEKSSLLRKNFNCEYLVDDCL